MENSVCIDIYQYKLINIKPSSNLKLNNFAPNEV